MWSYNVKKISLWSKTGYGTNSLMRSMVEAHNTVSGFPFPVNKTDQCHLSAAYFGFTHTYTHIAWGDAWVMTWHTCAAEWLKFCTDFNNWADGALSELQVQINNTSNRVTLTLSELQFCQKKDVIFYSDQVIFKEKVS